MEKGEGDNKREHGYRWKKVNFPLIHARNGKFCLVMGTKVSSNRKLRLGALSKLQP